jgi:CDP-glucose 4,6-dehydratase
VGLNPKLWKGKRILVTGHTGFKGSWLTFLLKDLGAEVIGISLEPEGPQALYLDARVSKEVQTEFFCDIRNESSIKQSIKEFKIDYVFHLAAQAFVRRSFRNPIESVTTNVCGTANILISALEIENLLGVIVVTTDKVYENLGTGVSFKETDKLGGIDPYSASKAAAELVTLSIGSANNPFKIPVTTVRAGNVIGGGDWGEERLVPDLVRALKTNNPLSIRNPNATRPWQYVLDCLYGYLLVAQSHLEKKNEFPKSVNFGPEKSLSVIELVSLFEEAFAKKINKKITEPSIPESEWLMLDSSLAKEYFNWEATLSPRQAVRLTADWYSRFLNGMDAQALVLESISEFKVGKW